MPRSISQVSIPKSLSKSPRLYNAKRQIEGSRGLLPQDLKKLQEDKYWQGWRKLVSQDVVKFVDDYEGRDATGQPAREMHPEDKVKLLRAPEMYFSRPQHVPDNLRQQIYFPNFTIALQRTPHLGPFFAQFQVPLSMGKLDFKSYLKNVYNVDVHHVRSFVVHQTSDREQPTSKYQRGKIVARSFKKKMTVQLVEPFEWPTELSKERLDQDDFEKSKYWDTLKKGYEMNRDRSEDFVSRPNTKHRRLLSEQAKALLEGRERWQPTWKQIAPSVRAMEGQNAQQVSSSNTSPNLLR